MKDKFKVSLLIVFLFIEYSGASAQNIGINSNGATPDNSAMLDISATNKGLLIPRVFLNSTSDAVTIPNPATSLLVWNINPSIGGGTGFYYNAGSAVIPVWIKLVTAGELSNNWSITGNSGTIDGVHFIGTKDGSPLNFRVNNQKSGRIDSMKANTSIGYRSLDVNTGTGNSAFGMFSLLNNTTGSNNSANGYTALRHNTTGTDNTANGDGALYSNNTGNNNTATGRYSLFSNGSGNNNTALGYNSGVIFSDLTNATAIGYNAQVRTSNSLVLGDTTNVNVGIGTGAPTAKLDIVGQVRIRGGAPGVGKVLTSDVSGAATWETPISGGGTLNEAYNFGGAGAGRVISANTGAVEINKTTQRQANLTISGQEYVTPSGNAASGIAIMAGVNRNNNKQLWITDQDAVTTPNATSAVVRIMPSRSLGVGVIDAIATDGSTLLPLILQGGGNYVGIGTAAPTQSLDINGQIRIRGGVPGAGKVLTSDANGTAIWETPIAGGGTLNEAYNFGGTGAGRIISANTGAVEISKTIQRQANLIISGQEYYEAGNAANGIAIMAGINRPGSKQLWITSQDFIATPNATNGVVRIIPESGSGAIDALATNGTTSLPLILQGAGSNVGIGTTAPTQRLDIDGQIRIRGGVPGTGKVLVSSADGTASWQAPTSLGDWTLSGNTGTVDGTHFIGTTDSRPLNFRVNNQKAGRIDTLGRNTSFGYRSLDANTGTANSAFGMNALRGNIAGNNNTAIGAEALYSNRAGYRAVAIGSRAMYYANSTMASFDSRNTAIGYEALRGSPNAANNTGYNNTVIGYQSMLFNSTGYSNVAVGERTLNENETGYSNTAIGQGALFYNRRGNENTAIGRDALLGNSSGSQNTAVGMNALQASRAGSGATAIGDSAMYYANSTTTAFINQNVAIGKEALRGSTNADNNTGNSNTVVGFRSLQNNSSGGMNVTLGTNTLVSNTLGGQNTAIGYQALLGNTIGSNNVALGSSAGDALVTGSNNVVIGYNAQASAINVSNEVTVGNSNHNVYRMFSASWTNASDRRLKHNIQPLKPGLDFVMQLQPVEYVYNNSDSERKTIGFIAQDVQSNLQAHQMDNYNLVSQLDEKYLGLNTTELIGVLTKAIQEQQQIINTLDAELNAQKNQNSDLEKRLIKLEMIMNE